MPEYQFEIGDVDLLDVEGNILITLDEWEPENADLLFKDSYDPEEDPFYDPYDAHDPFDPDPYDIFYGGTNFGWVIVWRDEVPELIWALEYEDPLLTFEFLNLIDEETFTDYPDIIFGDPNVEEFSQPDLYDEWSLEDIDHFFEFGLITYALVDYDNFTVTFPIYWLETTDHFDFSEVTYFWIYSYEFSLSLPTIFFLFPTVEEEMGDIEWNFNYTTYDDFYSLIDLWFEETYDEFISESVDKTWTLTTEDEYPSLIYDWTLIFYYDVEPEPITWIINQTDTFSFFGINRDYRIENIENFDVEFNIASVITEYFELPQNWEEIFQDQYGDEFMSIVVDEDFEPRFGLNPARIFYTTDGQGKYYEKGYKIYEWKLKFYDYFQFEPLYPVPRFMVKWEHLVTEEYFDFNNFDCNYYTSCHRIVLGTTDNFEIGSLLEFTYSLITEDYHEISDLLNALNFQLVDIDNMSDYIWFTQTHDTYDVGDFATFRKNPTTEDYYLEFPPLIWDIYHPFAVYLFDSPVTTPWLRHVTEMFSPDVGANEYQIFLIDEFDDIYIELREPAMITEDGYLVYRNGKLLIDTYKDFGDWGGIDR